MPHLQHGKALSHFHHGSFLKPKPRKASPFQSPPSGRRIMHRPDSSTKPCSACSALPFPCFWWLFHRRLFLKALALVGRQPIGFPFAAIFFGKDHFAPECGPCRLWPRLDRLKPLLGYVALGLSSLFSTTQRLVWLRGRDRPVGWLARGMVLMDAIFGGRPGPSPASAFACADDLV